MLNKRVDLTEFYSKIGAIEELFKIINSKNSQLEQNAVIKSQKSIVIDPAKNSHLEASQRYILSLIKTKELHAFAEFIMNYMVHNRFNNISSVPNNTIIVSEHLGMSDYEIVSKINLFDHTINCAISSIEICKEQPQVIRDIVMVICLLHDSGKAPSVQKDFKNKNEAHDILSARFSKEAMQDFDISDELQRSIFVTLFNHHNQDKNKEQTMYSSFLVASDVTARKLEKKFILSRIRGLK